MPKRRVTGKPIPDENDEKLVGFRISKARYEALRRLTFASMPNDPWGRKKTIAEFINEALEEKYDLTKLAKQK